MIKGMMTDLSMLRNKSPMNLTYIISLLIHGPSEVFFKITPSTMPLIKPARDATVRIFSFTD